MEDFDFNDTAVAPVSEQEFLMENLCVKKGRAAGGYEPPPTRSAAKRWKNVNEQNMMTRLNEMHIIKKQNAHMSKEAAREIIRKIPVELLAKEWLSKEDATVDMRAYLVDHILPTLILGVERLLREVDEKGLSATNRFEPEFNPINYLAQYLMRNNPRFSNFSEASPYVRGLREVSEEIKQELFTFEDNRLARIKAETRRKRTDRERHEQRIREGKEHRHAQLVAQFSEWTNYGEINYVELAVLQNALSYFLETVELLPPEIQDISKFGHPLEPTDESGKTLSVKEFAQYISLFVEDLPNEIFEMFLVHMSKCADAQNASADRENRRIILTNLFLICDYGVLGLLDRARIMTLFERFWDTLMETKEELMGTLRNPRRWPVVEVEEVDDILFDAWHDEPDGGLTTDEVEAQNKTLEAIRAELLEEIEINAAKDKAAKEKWKLEQLEQKSAGYRAKLYKYNVSDFMNLVQYPFLDTMEAPILHFLNIQDILTKDHDLYASTLTKTRRERKGGPDDMFDMKAFEENTSADDQISNSSRKERASVRSLDPRRFSIKSVNRNTNYRIQDSRLQVNEGFSFSQINRNNNTLGASDSPSDGDRGSEITLCPAKIKTVLKQRRRMNRATRVSSTSSESSEEAEDISRPDLLLRRLSAFGSDDEIPQQRFTFDPTPRSRLMTQKSNLMSERQKKCTVASPSTLPPIRMHKMVETERHTVGKDQQRQEREGTDCEALPVTCTSHDNDNETSDETETDVQHGTIYLPASAGTVIMNTLVSQVRETKTRTENKHVKIGANIISKEGKESFLKDKQSSNEGKQSTNGGQQTSNEGQQSNILDLHDEEGGQLEDASKPTQYREDNNNNDGNKGSLELSQTLHSCVQSETEDHVSDTVPVSDVGFDDVKIPEKPDEELKERSEESIKEGYDAEKMNQVEFACEEKIMTDSDVKSDVKSKSTMDGEIKNEFITETNTDVDVMKELVASQTRMLASKAYTSGKVMGNRVIERPQALVTENILDFLEDDNSNRKVEDSNINSCTRARATVTSSTMSETPVLSTFSEMFVNLSQFVQLFESFLGPRADPKIFATLVHFVTDNYQDDEPDKTDKLLQARENATLARKKGQLNALFEKWDNDASGFLELDDVTEFMCKFKDGQEIEAIKYAQLDLKKQSEFFDGRLSKREFRQFLNMVIDELPGKETFDLFVEFLMNSVERSYAERIRGEARKKWLQQINLAAQTGGTSMEPVYKAVFQALYKDGETHGGEKRISGSIAMLEVNKLEPSRGDLMLRYAACTPEDCQYMLGKPLYKNMKGISFQAAETGKPVHVPRVAKHGNVYFWNYDRDPKKRVGSFVAIPLKDNKKRVFGVLGVDTMIDPRKDTIFTKHEIQFFQGVAKAFSIAYHYVEKKRKFLRVLESAISWFRCRCPHVIEITVYFMEPSLNKPNDYVLRKIMVMDKNGKAEHIIELIRLLKKDNLFRGYLFDCIETSQTVVADVHEMRHTATPIRDLNGQANAIVDINTGKLKTLPWYESKEVQRLLRLLQMAYKELSRVSMGEEPNCILEAEKDPAVGVDIMFERLMLQELRDNVYRIDPQSYIEIKGYFEPPRVIAEVLRATLAVFKVDQVGEGEYDQWDDLKNCISSEFIHNIRTHDPISSANLADADKLRKYLKATFSVSFGEIAEEGSILAQQLYNWVFTCLSLIDYVLTMKESAEGGELLAAG